MICVGTAETVGTAKTVRTAETVGTEETVGTVGTVETVGSPNQLIPFPFHFFFSHFQNLFFCFHFTSPLDFNMALSIF